MDITGEYQIPARREVVFAALNDPAVLKACFPGCEALTRRADGTLAATLAGPAGSKLEGTADFSDVDAPGSLGIVGKAEGGAAGSAAARAEVRLTEAASGTLLSYVVTADARGALAEGGARHVEAVAARLADAFFAAFAARLGGDRSVAAPSLATPGFDDAAEDELVDRIEHRVDDQAENLAEVAEEVEQELEVAAGRGVLGGPYVWGLIALLVVIVALAIMR